MAVQESVYSLILKAVQAGIVGLGLPGDPPVVRRKKPIIGIDDALPIILVCPETEKKFKQDTRGIMIMDYPVLVVTAFAGNQLLETDVQTLLDWREAIRFELNKVTIAGAPSVTDCNLDTEPTYDFQRYKSELDSSALRFTYRSSESWNR